MVRVNITEKDKEALKRAKALVEKVKKKGDLPTTMEGVKEMYAVWNEVYKKRDKVSNCPSCRVRKFKQLKTTYELFELDKKFNPAPKKKAPKEGKVFKPNNKKKK